LQAAKKNVGDQYFRLRIAVPFGTKNAFIDEVIPDDAGFLSTISTNEIVEFRLNDRRNFSPAMSDHLRGSIDLIEVSVVHYFLIRDMTVEMTQSHTPFKKMRRLEPAIWKEYLNHEPQFNSDNMIIYHWSMKAAPADSIESFTALATFRAYDVRPLSIYALVGDSARSHGKRPAGMDGGIAHLSRFEAGSGRSVFGVRSQSLNLCASRPCGLVYRQAAKAETTEALRRAIELLTGFK